MIPVNEPVLGPLEEEYVLQCVRTGWISSAGSFLERFEENFARWCGRRFGVAVSNGTVALELALECLDLKDGDEVILPTFTIISCLQAVVYAGGTPVLVDADPATWCVKPDEVARRVSPRTRAVMPVHIYGHPVDMDPLMELAERRGIAVIEDAAEAHGAEYLRGWRNGGTGWVRCGSFGQMSCFSFYANKVITTGEGGMVLTDDAALAERLRSRRNLCFQPRRRFLHDELGHNFRLTNLQAALGVAQLERVDEIVARKRAIGAGYTASLSGIDGVQLPIEASWARSIYWMYGMVLDEATGWDAESAAGHLKDQGIETRPFFLGMHAQPVVRSRWPQGEAFPVADRLAKQGLYLPSGLALTDEQLARVSEAVRHMMKRRPGKLL